jgi:hypothetical protein
MPEDVTPGLTPYQALTAEVLLLEQQLHQEEVLLPRRLQEAEVNEVILQTHFARLPLYERIHYWITRRKVIPCSEDALRTEFDIHPFSVIRRREIKREEIARDLSTIIGSIGDRGGLHNTSSARIGGYLEETDEGYRMQRQQLHERTAILQGARGYLTVLQKAQTEVTASINGTGSYFEVLTPSDEPADLGRNHAELMRATRAFRREYEQFLAKGVGEEYPAFEQHIITLEGHTSSETQGQLQSDLDEIISDMQQLVLRLEEETHGIRDGLLQRRDRVYQQILHENKEPALQK